MAKITLIGDVHGKIDQLLHIYEGLSTPSIQLGDMGCGFGDIPRFSENNTFIRGNHDDPAIARRHPNYLGDYGYIESNGVFYMGGAYSVDFQYRQFLDLTSGGMNKCWWEDEELPMIELNKALNLYESVKPRIVVSHETPAKAGLTLLRLMNARLFKGACSDSRTAQTMQAMFSIHQPELWVFGHYHFSKDFVIDKTKFLCLNELETYTLDTENPV